MVDKKIYFVNPLKLQNGIVQRDFSEVVDRVNRLAQVREMRNGNDPAKVSLVKSLQIAQREFERGQSDEYQLNEDTVCRIIIDQARTGGELKTVSHLAEFWARKIVLDDKTH